MNSPVLTAAEAVCWLRLDDDHEDIEQAVRALKRLVQIGKIRPLRCGRTHKYTITELERFIRDEVELGTPSPYPEAEKPPRRDSNGDGSKIVHRIVHKPDGFPP